MNILDQLFPEMIYENVALTDMPEELFSLYVRKLTKEKNNVLLVTSSLMEANKLYRRISTYLKEVYLFPMDDFLTSEAIAISPDLMITRLETLKEITSDRSFSVVITNMMGYLRFLPTKDDFCKLCLSLSVDLEMKRDSVIETLFKLGYQKESLVTKTGEFGSRGFIIDVFPLGEEHPIRIEFFGDTIESLRYFDEATQKSISPLEHITIFPYTEVLSDQEIPQENKTSKYLPQYATVANIKDYLKNAITIYKDIAFIKTNYKNLQEEILEYRHEKDQAFSNDYMFSLEELYDDTAIFYDTLDNLHSKEIKICSFQSHDLPLFNDNQEAIEQFIRKKIKEEKTILICLRDYQLKALERKLNFPLVLTDFDHIKERQINLIPVEVTSGFSYQHYVFLTSHELYKEKEVNKRYKTNFKYSKKITDLAKLEIGDYVVHQAHGIGVYNGLKTLKQNEYLKDYIEVLYQGKDKLYIPVEKIELLSKYTGKEGIAPVINKLSGNSFEKVKNRVKSKVQDMAASLLKIQAERESQKGFAYSKDTKLQEEFEQAFPYEPTPDQVLAIKQIKEDMEQPHPMDRLLVGDVGYGKTEVAFRAVFKAIMDGKQVLFLCPTTILSSQHYENAKQRFKDFPVNIGLLNRFTTPKETKKIISQLETGIIDLVIGTHRILSNDIKVKNLGLLIIDEEQRFGVRHKEKIKDYKNMIDVLTLTATPIPRTLQMSIVGLRSLSLIETPPMDRYPIQTYVISENQQLIREAIYKEMSRDGQVFLLYNRVEQMEKKVVEIKKLVPEARIIFAHGRMSKEEIEDKMQTFIHHEADVLICSTIIETGIDIPNVNTLIILDADRFGLSQLYQIRGRVGRSNKIAYCYLMYHPSKVLTETAMKRLQVIREFTELGSGFSIATRDLSIRGAGDILGSEQAGFIDSVGIDLYLKLLNAEIARLKGEEVPEEEEEASNQLPSISVSTHISDSYVEDVDLKIEIHQLINTITTKEQLETVKETLEDRFGVLKEDILIYMYEEWFESMVKKIPVTSVRQTKNSIELHFNKEITKTLDTEKIFLKAFEINTMFRFKSRGDDLTIILDTIKLEKHPIYYLTSLLNAILEILKKDIT